MEKITKPINSQIEELKTLKDLEWKDDDGVSYGQVYTEELKAEAVKWYHRSDDNKHKFIMDFFNLTDEDLK